MLRPQQSHIKNISKIPNLPSTSPCLHLKPKSKPRIELENRTPKIQNKNSKTHHPPLLTTTPECDTQTRTARHRSSVSPWTRQSSINTTAATASNNKLAIATTRAAPTTKTTTSEFHLANAYPIQRVTKSHPPLNRTRNLRKKTHHAHLPAAVFLHFFPSGSWKHIRTHKEQDQERKKKKSQNPKLISFRPHLVVSAAVVLRSLSPPPPRGRWRGEELPEFARLVDRVRVAGEVSSPSLIRLAI
jgi:hypothetical protein